MKKPVIAITPMTTMEQNGWWLRTNYMTPVAAADAVPVMLPQTAELASEMAERFDGFLFTGGPDVSPGLYGQPVRPYPMFLSEERDAYEMRLLEAVLKLGKPVLAICRGIQLLNVFYGGTLYQDLPLEHPSCIPHYMERPYDRFAHDVYLTKGEPLAEVLGQTCLPVNSCHHQAIRDLAPGLQEMGRSSDHLIEAVYDPNIPFVWGVQWHPEHLADKDLPSQMLFNELVQYASK